MIFARCNGIPSGQDQTFDITYPALDAPSVLLRVVANDFDIQERGVGDSGDVLPFTAREIDRVARIGDDAKSKVQVVRRYAIREAVAFALNVYRAQISQRLLDSVDAQVKGPEAL